MSSSVALFRCDASSDTGAGHVTRSCAVAEALSLLGWKVVFVVGPTTLDTVPSLATSGFECRIVYGGVDHEIEVLDGISGAKAALLVVDHYRRDEEFEKSARRCAERILVFDDEGSRTHDCDVLIDAACADPSRYSALLPKQALILNGPRFALVRSQFLHQRSAARTRRDGRPARHILVSFGATDPGNLTGLVLEAIVRRIENVSITVSLSSQAPHLRTLQDRYAADIRLIVDAPDMAQLIAEADLGIGAAGTSAYERAALGLPAIMFTGADNQAGIARMMVQAGAARDGGRFEVHWKERLIANIDNLITDHEARMQMTLAAFDLVDGRGAARIAVASTGQIATKFNQAVALRLAEPTDEQWLLDLQRQPETRRFSRNPATPIATEHHDWMAGALADHDKVLTVIVMDGVPAGLLRLDRRQKLDHRARYEVSVAVDPTQHRRGVGLAGLRLARRLLPGAFLDAFILPANTASTRLFEQAGYNYMGDELYRSTPE